MLRIVIRVDGREIEKRRGTGEFIAFVQYRNAAGTVWQNHNSLDLTTVRKGMQTLYFDTTFYAFVLPGDYTVSLAICDSTTSEHSATVRKVHVDPLRPDPLPAAWNALPPVDIVPAVTDPPDVWYVPDISTHLNLTVANRKPVRIEILVNTTPSQRSAGSLTALRANMSLLIPALKILSKLGISSGMVNAELLDLTHRKVIFRQEDVRDLNWPGIAAFFQTNHPGIVDAATLQGQWKMRKFFWEEVNRRMEPRDDGAVPVTIVLSGPAFLEDQEPIDSGFTTPAPPGGNLFYIRYRSQQITMRGNPPRMFGGTMMGRGGIARQTAMNRPVDPDFRPVMPVDDLEHTVEPLNARIFDVASPQQFRRVLAAILDRISSL
jgi:hypothetical protein